MPPGYDYRSNPDSVLMTLSPRFDDVAPDGQVAHCERNLENQERKASEALRIADQTDDPAVYVGCTLLSEIAATGESSMESKAHWERVYSTKGSDEVSWYQANPAPSLRLLNDAGIGPNT